MGHAAEPDGFALVQGEFSVPGVPGWEVEGLYGPVIDGLRFTLEADTSFSHDVRRPGLVGLMLPEELGFEWSGSSSEDARASESGVDRRKSGFDRSRSNEADPWWAPKVPKAGIGARVVTPILVGGLVMVRLRAIISA